jgi:type IV pilus assembly protein PilF
MYIRLWLSCCVLLLTACVTEIGGPVDTVKASAANVQLGMEYMQQNNMPQANEKLNKAIDQDPKSASAHNAYAMLQDRLLQKDVAEKHYKIATELDPGNSAAANNYGAFLCRNNREAESEAYFMQALENPLYETPEFAYTNAALCLLQIRENDRARVYLTKALAANNGFPVALITAADLFYEDQNFESTILYMNRYHQVTNPSARSLWLEIRAELELGRIRNAEELASQLQAGFPLSNEYKAWQDLN